MHLPLYTQVSALVLPPQPCLITPHPLLVSSRYPDGPFVCGKAFTFADAALFQIIHNQEQTGGKKLRTDAYPLLSKLYEAVEALPSLKAYLSSR